MQVNKEKVEEENIYFNININLDNLVLIENRQCYIGVLSILVYFKKNSNQNNVDACSSAD